MTIRPVETNLTAPYWEASRKGRLLIQRCTSCGHRWHPPAPVCVRCRRRDIVWDEAGGRGTLRSFTVVRRAAHRALESVLPYVIALVELEEGPLILTNLIESDLGQIDVGMEVELVLHRTVGGEALVCARRSVRP